MKTSKLIRSAIILFCISLFSSDVSAQFEYFTGSWKAFNHKTQMEKLTEDDDHVVKYTETLENSLSDNGRNMLVAYSRMDQMGQQAIQSFNLIKDIEGNITGSDVMNTIKYTGKITGNSNEQIISLTGYFETGSGGTFAMELIYQNTETGKVLQMKQLLSVGSENPLDQTDINNIYRGMEIETRPGTGDNAGVTYWQVMYFKPQSE